MALGRDAPAAVPIRSDSCHEDVADDTDEHVPAIHEGKATEHFLLNHAAVILELLSEPLRETFIVCHLLLPLSATPSIGL